MTRAQSVRSHPAPRAPWWWTFAVALYVGAALLFVFSRTGTDPDLWGHLLFGRDLWLTGVVNRPDPYSFVTAGREWFNHEWLAETISWKAWEWGGTMGLVGLKTGLAMLMVLVMYRQLRRRGVTDATAGLLVVLPSALIALGMYSLRPQAFTYLCFLALLLILRGAEPRAGQRLWLLVPLFAVWANLHGGFLAGLAILGVYALAALAEGVVRRPGGKPAWRALAHPMVLVAVASALATWLNPYGPRYWGFLRTAFEPRGEIAEWNAMQIGTPLGIVFLLLVLLAWFGVARTRRPVSPASLMALFVMTVGPLVAIRHAPLFAIAFVVLAAEHVASALRGTHDDLEQAPAAVSAKTPAYPRLERLRPWIAAILVAQAVPLFAWSTRNFSCVDVDEGMPVRAVGLLKASGVEGNLAVLFDWGEYAIWHLSPRLKVSMDGRRETVYSDDAYWRDHRFTFALGDWRRLLREERVDLVLASRNFPVFSAMKLLPDWELAYEDRQAGLFARRGSSVLARLRATPVPPVPARPCFP